MGDKLKLPVGIDDFEKIRRNTFYYIDKTKLIEQLFVNWGEVNLFTRPRRFGKTLNMSMLKCFFEIGADETLFNGLYISGNRQLCEEHMGKYPVIFLSLKNVEGLTFENAKYQMAELVGREAERFGFLKQSERLSENDKEVYLALTRKVNGKYVIDDDILYASLQTLSEMLYKHYGKKTVILIDEYDVPLENAYFAGFYDEMTAFIRSLMESALKTNESLKLAVITGCLRISKESIFTGLNNMNVISVISDSFAEYFGFTEDEVTGMLEYYELEDKAEDMKKWYDGYLFGQTHVYNPWSVISYLNGVIADRITYPRPYWANTSSNSVIKEMIEKSDDTTRAELEDIMSGKTIAKPIHEDITYEDIYSSQDNLWNFLFFTGYLKAVDTHMVGARVYMIMAIPNMEVRYIYENTIMEWFRRRVMKLDLAPLHHALLDGNAPTLEELIKGYLKASISYYDENESFYHGFILGLMSSLEQYRILSNRETGNGRADILLKPYDEQYTAVIIELKYAKEFRGLEDGCQKALQQIETMHYADELVEDGYQSILMYGICFYKKNCKVECRKYS